MKRNVDQIESQNHSWGTLNFLQMADSCFCTLCNFWRQSMVQRGRLRDLRCENWFCSSDLVSESTIKYADVLLFLHNSNSKMCLRTLEQVAFPQGESRRLFCCKKAQLCSHHTKQKIMAPRCKWKTPDNHFDLNGFQIGISVRDAPGSLPFSTGGTDWPEAGATNPLWWYIHVWTGSWAQSLRSRLHATQPSRDVHCRNHICLSETWSEVCQICLHQTLTVRT